MKKIILPLLTAFVAIMAASCSKIAIEPLSGNLFPKASEIKLDKLSSLNVEKGEKTRTFTLTFSGDPAVKLTLVGNTYFLAPNTYTAGETNAAGNGNYIISGTTINGKNAVSGSVIVKKSGEANVYSTDDEYVIDCMFFLSDGESCKVLWTGNLEFEPDPEPVKLTQVFSAQSNLASGVNSVTMSLGSADISATYDAATYTTTWSGSGNYLAIDLYSADGFLHEGTYKASAKGGEINEGEFGIGWDPGDIYGWGVMFTDWGTCWWTVDNGATSAEKITSGTIEVAKKGSKWVITWGSEATYPKWAVFEGAIDALTPGDAPAAEYSFVDTPTPGAMDSDWQTHDDVTTHNVTILNKANEEVAYFQLVLANDVTDLSGEYPVMEYAHEDHTAGNGYDAGAWGVGGCRYYKDGALVLINPGETVTVTSLGDGAYEFSGDGFDFVTGDTGSGGDVTPEFVITDTATPGAMDSNWQTHDDVTTHNLTLTNAAGEEVSYFQLVLANGTTDLSGEYPVMEYAHEDHTAGNGYDAGAWGVGGCRYIKDGTLVLINPGETVTVTAVSDGVYKIAGEGFEFVGELAE